MDSQKALPLGFEFVDIEIINHSELNDETESRWDCDQCSLYFLTKEKLLEHAKNHEDTEIIKCKYCNKPLSKENKDGYANKKCETCEYRCSVCPQRFLRHSSLLNHEKNHTPSKKRKGNANNKKFVNGVEQANSASLSVVGKNYTKTSTECQESELDSAAEKSSVSPKKRRKIETEIVSKEKSDTDVDESAPRNKKTRKQLTQRKTSTDNDENKMCSNKTNRQPTPTTENSVNYKPFSCHVCGNTFASDNALLGHIQTHGKNASKAFTCKHCNEEFDDIYKMQYHLAICPLAEDELETSFAKDITPKPFVKNIGSASRKLLPDGSSVVRKRGRPKKVVLPEDINDSLQFSERPTRASKRKTVDSMETTNKPPNTKSSSLQRCSKRVRPESVEMGSELFNESDDNESEKEESLSMDDEVGDNLDESFELEEDSRKKIHACPFPKCLAKFNREKALLCHMRNHDDEYDEALVCHKCDIPFEDRQSLNEHKDICKGIKEEKDDDFYEPDHSQASCSEKKPTNTFQRTKGNFTCDICGKRYITQERLQRHSAKLHPNFTCRICKDVFDDKNLLNDHFYENHPNNSLFYCAICEVDFINESFLLIHEKDYHKDSTCASNIAETTEEQDVTYKIKPRLKTLTGHSYASVMANDKTALRNTQFWCPACSANFNLRESMRIHFASEHIIKMNTEYKCQICNIAKPSVKMMVYHLEVHSFNILSVNRFSRLRDCILNDKPRKSTWNKVSTNTSLTPQTAIPKECRTESNYELVERENGTSKAKEGTSKRNHKRAQISLGTLKKSSSTRFALRKTLGKYKKRVYKRPQKHRQIANYYKTRLARKNAVEVINNGNHTLDTNRTTSERPQKAKVQNGHCEDDRQLEDNVSLQLSVEEEDGHSNNHTPGGDVDKLAHTNKTDVLRKTVVKCHLQEEVPGENPVHSRSKRLRSDNKNTRSITQQIKAKKLNNNEKSIETKEMTNTVEEEQPKSYNCSMCMNVFSNRLELLDHVSLHI